jgi:aminotransferase
LQQAGAMALKSPESYYQNLAKSYHEKRERLLKILSTAGFRVFKPRGAYYIMTDISGFDFNGARRSNSEKTTNDVAFAKFLVEKVGVAVVPGSSFYGNAADGCTQVRFTFCKKESTLAAAEQRLARLPQHLTDFRAHA